MAWSTLQTYSIEFQINMYAPSIASSTWVTQDTVDGLEHPNTSPSWGIVSTECNINPHGFLHRPPFPSMPNKTARTLIRYNQSQ